MSATPDAVIRTWFEELWNQGKEDTIKRLFAADGLAHGLGPGGQALRGPDAYRPFFHSFRGAFPDIRVTVERTVTQGDMVAAHCRVRGTHLGPQLGLAATRKPVDFYGMCFARIADGKIVEAWNCFDFLTCYQHIDAMPQLPA